MAERSKTSVSGRSLAGIAGSISTGSMVVSLLWALRVASGRGLCDGPIRRPEKSYPLWFVTVCDLEWGGPASRWAVAPDVGREGGGGGGAGIENLIRTTGNSS